MKKVIFVLIISLVSFWACNTENGANDGQVKQLESKIKDLEAELRPGLGILMNQVQTYHIKLYLSIRNQNHELTSYILHELEEQFETLVDVHNVHDKIELGVIAEETMLPLIEEMQRANEIQDSVLLMQSFDQLTITCNNCHKTSKHPFIRIKTPEGQYFPNQDFTTLQ